ncbi:unnamed protein product (macronuclear) [Paramecium tetraurelia]|uniref:RING-type domain-containing protein n=1 Tax=Paramecium tetraurelia TaxID=5888 RepID=A0E7H6_PARTE|nr:uncharacterized protein GSPATT00023971001 [Paramecium tetraurelia]CAK91243.1 unnamed protein product [Paramecium tetraurelia]|eukprot:XP_001458640.1 hypothetical protein (macronuclear) [Paramecium tetraurelia strain d4-2]
MFILLHLFLQCLGQTQTFLNLEIGIHILQTFQRGPKPNHKIVVKLEQAIFDSTQLLICDSEITLLKENCIYDVNSYDLKRNTQIIQLVHGFKVEKYQMQLLSMKQFNEFPQVIGTYSKSISNFSITITTLDISECASQCQNEGICKDGMCECVQGYFGADCSIVALDITHESRYHKNGFYYFNIKGCDQNSCSLSINFTQVGTYRQTCYAEDWYLLQQNMIEKREIKISDVQSCLSNINNQKLSPQQFSYYIFYFETECENSQEPNIQNTKIILIIVITTVGGSISLCCCIICYYYFFRRQKEEHQILPTISLYPKTDIQRYLPKQLYKTLINQYPGLANTDECLICLDKIKEQDQVRLTYCTHIFHVQCLDNWLEKNRICPACRSELDEVTLIKIAKLRKNDSLMFENKASRLYGDMGTPNLTMTPQLRSVEITHRH